MSSQDSVQDAVALIKSGRRDEARAILTGILKSDRDNLAAWAGMVQVANNREEAAACLRQVLRLKPGDPWATRQLEKLEPAPPAPAPPAPPSPPSPPAYAAPATLPSRPAPTAPESADLTARTQPSPRAPLADTDSWTDVSEATPVSAADATARLEPEPLRRVAEAADESAPTPPAEKPARGRSNTLLYVGIGVLVLALCVIGAGLAWTLIGGMQSVNALMSGGGAGGGVYDGGDGYNTTQVQTIPLGQTRQARLDDLFDAHNWQFEGTAGQPVTIRVDGLEDSDPHAKLIDPRGQVIAEDDDSGGGYNALIVTTLPSDGTYTVRIDMWTTGPYAITVE
jgi:hypothetical protein